MAHAIRNGWLREWWRELASGRELRVHTAHREEKLVAALPLARRGRVLEFMAGEDAPLGDVLLRGGEDDSVAAELVERAAGAGGYAFADLFGARHRTRLLESPAARRLRLVERVEAPVLDLSAGWGPSTAQRRARRSGTCTGAGGASSPSSGE